MDTNSMVLIAQKLVEMEQSLINNVMMETWLMAMAALLTVQSNSTTNALVVLTYPSRPVGKFVEMDCWLMIPAMMETRLMETVAVINVQ